MCVCAVLVTHCTLSIPRYIHYQTTCTAYSLLKSVFKFFDLRVNLIGASLSEAIDIFYRRTDRSYSTYRACALLEEELVY